MEGTAHLRFEKPGRTGFQVEWIRAPDRIKRPVDLAKALSVLYSGCFRIQLGNRVVQLRRSRLGLALGPHYALVAPQGLDAIERNATIQ
jgi:hypothetical protein